MVPRSHALAIAFVLGATACGDESTGPPPTAELAIENVNVRGPSVLLSGTSGAVVRCDVKFRATASGRGSATFRDATFMFFAGVDHGAPVDVLEISAQEVRDAWGGGTVEAGTSMESVWWFQLGAPFVLTGEFRYAQSPGGPVASVPVRVVCGPEAPASSPPPAITELTLSAPADGLEPTDTLVVSYTATAALGLWHTAVELTGPCEVSAEFAENLSTSIARTVSLPVPAGCTLGVPFSVTVNAWDAALRGVGRASTGPSLVDHTPPRISASVTPVDGAATSRIQFSADSIDLSVVAFDNSGRFTMVYELLPAGLRDSIAVDANFQGRLSVPVPADVTGSVQIRLFTRDAAGLTSPEVITPPGAIWVYPTVERRTLQTSFEAGARDIVIDAERELIYVLSWNGAHIRALSATTLAVTRLIQLSGTPTSLDLTPSRDSLLVTHAGGLSVIDLRETTPVVTNIPLTLDASVMQSPQRVVALANGKALVATAGEAARAYQLFEVDLANGTHRVRTDVAETARATSMQRSPDRAAVVFNGGPGHFRRYDVTTDQFTLGGDVRPYHVTFSLDRGGQHNALSLDIYDASLTFLRRVESIFGAADVVVPVAISPDGQYLYHKSSLGVMRSRVDDGALVDRSRNPTAADLMRIASDGRFLVTGAGVTTAEISLVRLQ